MKRLYRVTVLVEVKADREKGFDAALKRIYDDPPWLSVASSGEFPYSIETQTDAPTVKLVEGRAELDQPYCDGEERRGNARVACGLPPGHTGPCDYVRGL